MKSTPTKVARVNPETVNSGRMASLDAKAEFPVVACPGEGGRWPGGGGRAGRGRAGRSRAEAGRAHRGRQQRGPHPGHVLPVPGVPGEQPDQEQPCSRLAVLPTEAGAREAQLLCICMP